MITQQSKGAKAMEGESGLKLMNCRETAKFLGISERKLWGLTKKGILPMVKMDKTVRYRPEDVRKYVESCLSATA